MICMEIVNIVREHGIKFRSDIKNLLGILA